MWNKVQCFFMGHHGVSGFLTFMGTDSIAIAADVANKN